MTILDKLDLGQRLDREQYNKRLEDEQRRLLQLRLHLGGQMGSGQRGPGLLVLFEGPDAAGKGGAIKAIVGHLDPRHCAVLNYAAPTREEKEHHFLWRFWREVPGLGEMVRGRFRGRIRRGRRVRRRFGEDAFVERQVAEHFVGRDMDEAERLSGGTELAPIGERRLEQREGAFDVGAEEHRGAVDRAVDVRFRGEMDDPVDLLATQDIEHLLLAADVFVVEAVIVCLRHGS